jgi:hypothetical protein
VRRYLSRSCTEDLKAAPVTTSEKATNHLGHYKASLPLRLSAPRYLGCPAFDVFKTPTSNKSTHIRSTEQSFLSNAQSPVIQRSQLRIRYTRCVPSLAQSLLVSRAHNRQDCVLEAVINDSRGRPLNYSVIGLTKFECKSASLDAICMATRRFEK